MITTKSFEKENYLQYIPSSKLILTTQGFDKNIHYPRHSFKNKSDEVVFIGLCEESREQIVDLLIQNKIKVKIAGHGWQNFIKKHNSRFLNYLGTSLWKDDYAREISGSYFGIGLLSKRFPELHTTRTFEIPACGTALLTERNSETECFYNDDEVIFYNSTEDLVEKITYYRKNVDRLKQLTLNGKNKVTQGGFDYHSILTEILNKIK